ncbi:MAG: hypothetical protein JKY96_06150 [Phycisphaerales bacterium]|nr:hypothetical protein [Phycisphaerales bacterium]
MNQRTTQLIYFGVPTLAFIAIRVFMGGPQSVQASEGLTTETDAPLPSMVIGETSTDTGVSAREVCEGIHGHLSPFWHDELVEIQEPQIEYPVEYQPGTERIIPIFEVTSILPHPTRPLAVINSKPYRLGAKIFPGWTLTAINGDQRTITIKGPTGEIQVVPISRR